MTRNLAPATAALAAALAALLPQVAGATTAQSGPVNIVSTLFANEAPTVHKVALEQPAEEIVPPSPVRQIVARVDISEQRMYVSVNGEEVHTFTVSTAGRGYVTPTGSWTPTRMHRMWYSRKYDNAPMPHSIFFHEGYAVHATDKISRLGTPASHGCVRLHPDDARTFFSMVMEAGRANTRIVITQ
jgi:lipoprotein-anchoring transpeptidase ErfK/SrfK